MNEIETKNDLLSLESLVLQAPKDILSFIQLIKPDYQVNWHHKVITDTINRFIFDDLKRLMIFAPPQTGKSEIVSRCLPAYIFGVNPNARIGLISYNDEFAIDFVRDIKMMMNSTEYQLLFPKTKLNSKNVVTSIQSFAKNTSHTFDIVGYSGNLRAVGRDGSITGRPFTHLIVDDMIKNSMESMSETYRNTIWSLWKSAIWTRVRNVTRVILMNTRWHTDDLAGRILNSDNYGVWDILRIQAIKE
jgi:hypothetical protein